MKPRLFLLLISFLVGASADFMRGRWPDYFSPLSAGIGMLLAFVCADVFLPQLTKPRRRRVVGLLWSIGYVACAHALPIVLAGLVQIPRVGAQFLPDVAAGAWYTLRQAWLPVAAGGAAVYLGFQIFDFRFRIAGRRDAAGSKSEI